MSVIYRAKLQYDSLIDEILDRIPSWIWSSSSTTFLDPAMGAGQIVNRIVKRLRDTSHSDDNIRERVVGVESTIIPFRMVAQSSIPGQFSRQMKDTRMKFDVVVGNPPYQNSGVAGNFSLWPSFIDLSIRHVKDRGYVALVVPQTWASNEIEPGPRAKDSSCVRSTCFSKGHLIHVDFDIAHHFDVASTFSTFLFQKGASGLTSVKTRDGSYTVDYRTVPWMPVIGDERVTSILNKVCWSRVDKLRLVNDGKETCGFRVGADNISTEQSEVFKWKIANTSAQYSRDQFLWSSEKHPAQNAKKVIFSDSGYDAPFYDDDVCGLGHHARAVLVESEDEAAAVISFLGSRLVRFIASTKPNTGAASDVSLVMRDLPHVTSMMTDQELYEYFGLSSDEVTLIERS